MSADLEAIANELQRLKRDGVEHVFIDDTTLGLLSVNPQKTRPREPAKTEAPTSAEDIASLGSLINEPNVNKVAPEPVCIAEPTASIPEPPTVQLPDGSQADRMAALREIVSNCATCNSHLGQHGKIVFGEGSPSADIIFCGDAPGADEERAGSPFVGKAGQLLDKIVTAMGLERKNIYMTNILKWRPEHDKPYGNRPPNDREVQFCLPYLRAQIEVIQPKVIIALGNTTIKGLLGPDPNRKMATARGSWAEFCGAPVMITFHPSYLLRNGTLKTKRMVWEDMLQVMERCSIEISAKQRAFFLPKS